MGKEVKAIHKEKSSRVGVMICLTSGSGANGHTLQSLEGGLSFPCMI